jgi:hypothetical protein
MPANPSFTMLNRAATQRIQELISRLTDSDYLKPVGVHWSVAVALAHIAFWDRRILFILDKSEQEGKLYDMALDVTLNDILLPFWAAIPAHEAARMAIETAKEVDRRLEAAPPALLDLMADRNVRLVARSRHRNEHLGEVDAALTSSVS